MGVETDREPFAHVPRCACEVAGAPYENVRDPKCIEWDAVVRQWRASDRAELIAATRKQVRGEAVEAIRAEETRLRTWARQMGDQASEYAADATDGAARIVAGLGGEPS